VALGEGNAVEALVMLMACFNANAFSTMYIVGYRYATWVERN